VSDPGGVRAAAREFALGLPGAHEDFPWGGSVAKVRGKVFVFLGRDEGDEPGLSVKLAESHAHALTLPGAAPTGYGLGRAGWVSLPLGEETPVELVRDLVEESYRIVAPKRLVRELDERG
jgi:predicted DNA-binding protein (MmcQ/YjbR family)